MRPSRLIVALAALGLALPAAAVAKPANRPPARATRPPVRAARPAPRVISEQQFVLPAAGPYMVRLANVRGRVMVRSWNTNVVYMKATKRAEAAIAGNEADLYARAEAVASRPVADTVSIETRFGSRSAGSARLLASQLDHVDVDYLLAVPPQTAIEITQEYGPVTAYGLDGRAQIFTREGAIALADLHGRADAENEAGAIAFTGIQGDAVARTQRGDVSFGGVTGDVVARSNSGAIRIQVPARFAGEVSYHTLRGTIYTDLTTFNTRMDAGETGYEGVLRGPLASRQPVAVRCRLDTVSGDLTMGTVRGLAAHHE